MIDPFSGVCYTMGALSTGGQVPRAVFVQGVGMGDLVAMVLVLDGLLTAVLGRRFIAWQRRLVPDWYKVALDGLLELPEGLLRGAAAAEAVLGLVLLARRGNVIRHE